MHTLWVLIIGGIIGIIAGAITGLGDRMGCLLKIISGLVGAWLGVRIFGYVGWMVAGIPIFPAIIGATLLVIVLSFFLRR